MATETIRKNLELNKATVDWFYETYPDANLSAIISQLFDRFREVTDRTPEYYINLAVESLKDEI